MPTRRDTFRLGDVDGRLQTVSLALLLTPVVLDNCVLLVNTNVLVSLQSLLRYWHRIKQEPEDRQCVVTRSPRQSPEPESCIPVLYYTTPSTDDFIISIFKDNRLCFIHYRSLRLLCWWLYSVGDDVTDWQYLPCLSSRCDWL